METSSSWRMLDCPARDGVRFISSQFRFFIFIFRLQPPVFGCCPGSWEVSRGVFCGFACRNSNRRDARDKKRIQRVAQGIWP